RGEVDVERSETAGEGGSDSVEAESPHPAADLSLWQSDRANRDRRDGRWIGEGQIESPAAAKGSDKWRSTFVAGAEKSPAGALEVSPAASDRPLCCRFRYDRWQADR